MAVRNSRRQYTLMLSDLRQRTEQAASILEGLDLTVRKPKLKKTIETSISVSRRALDSLSLCSRLVVLIVDRRSQLVKAQNPTAQELSILAKATDLLELQIAEYKALVSSVDPLAHCGGLVELCLADTCSLVRRTRRLIRGIADSKLAEGVIESSAA